MISILIYGLAVLAGFSSPIAAQNCQAAPAQRFQTQMASGFTSKVLLSGLKAPRGMVFDTAGNLLVVEQGGGGVRLVTLAESGGSVCVTASKQIVADSSLNHGIDLSADGKTLFVSSLSAVYAYTYDATAGTATNKKTVIQNMQNGGHSTRTLLASKAYPDILLVSRGSNANIDAPTTSASSGRSIIKYYKISQIMQTAADMTRDGTVLGYGLRNSVGMGEHPYTGGIWSVENSMDDVKRQNRDVHNENPAEELNYHGQLNDTANPYQGKSYGYPTCVAAWKPSDLGNTALKVGDHFIPNLASGQDAATADAACAQFQTPRLSFPAHTAPLDIKFSKIGTAYVSFHGSWDRSPPDGYRLMKINFGPDGQPTEPSTSTTATIPIMQNTNTGSCPNSCFRPVGLAFDKAGRLFMSSDQSNEIYVVTGPF